MSTVSDPELEFRLAALRAGFWLGWLSIAALVASLSLGHRVDHRNVVLGLIVAAALANAVMMLLPWRVWLAARRGQSGLDIWSVALVGFAVALVVVAGANSDFDLIFFLVLPFVATAQTGLRRRVGIVACGGAFLLAMRVAPAAPSSSTVVFRALLLTAAVVLALVLGRAIREQASVRAEAAARADLERVLLAEAHHRVKNSLQTVADLLLLARPRGAEGAAFDETAGRIRSIAAVHRLLAETRGRDVLAGDILRAVAATASEPVSIQSDEVLLPTETGQQLGIVANELIENALRHGAPPVSVRLSAGETLRLIVEDKGSHLNGKPRGLGLQLVDQVVEHGLHGSFELAPLAGGGTHAEVVFRADAHSDR